MTVDEIKKCVMFQTNNDAADVGDFSPYLLSYINEGYDCLVYALAKEHIASDSAAYPVLMEDTDVPRLPEWMHPCIANWATWCVYRGGNPARQNRGVPFRASAEETIAAIHGGFGITNFHNVPR